MTFTILARDTQTGELGVGSFSFALAVGAGVVHQGQDGGLVVIQARGEPSWSSRLFAGLDADEWAQAVRQLEDDRRLAASQLAALTVAGETFAFTGPETERYADAVCRPDLCCAANLMFAKGVPRSAADHFDNRTSGPLARRLVDAMRHVDDLGGDVRGRMSAFVRTYPIGGTAASVDLRVDLHSDPVAELARLVRIHEAHGLVASALDQDGAYADVVATEAAYRLAPESPVVASAYLLSRLRARDIAPEAASDLARHVHTLEPELPERLRRLEEAGRLPAGTVAHLAWTNSV